MIRREKRNEDYMAKLEVLFWVVEIGAKEFAPTIIHRTESPITGVNIPRTVSPNC